MILKMLPDEVWEQILIHIDYNELPKLKNVSTVWNGIVTRFVHVKYRYYEKCCKEIPEKYWSSILAPMEYPEIQNNDFHAARKHSHIWMSMYGSWIGWNSLTDKIPSYQTVTVPGRIFDHKVTGKIVAISGDDDYVRFHDLSEENKILPRKLDNYPKKMDFSMKYGSVLLVGCYYHDRCEIRVRKWELDSCQTIQSAKFSEGFDASLSLDHCELFGGASSIDNRKTTKHNPFDECCKMNIKIHESDGKTREFWVPKTFRHMTYRQRHSKDWPLLATIMANTFGVYCSKLSIIRPSVPTNRSFGSCGTNFNYSWRFERCTLSFSVDGREWKFYDTQRDLKLTSGVTALRYHIGLLIIGLESGELQIFYVKDCLETLNFNEMPFLTVKLDCCPIFNIKVTDYNSTQYIIARTDFQLHIVKFE